MSRIYKIRKNPKIEYIDTPKTPVDNIVENNTTYPPKNENKIETSEPIAEETPAEILDKPTDNISTNLLSVPTFDATTEIIHPVDNIEVLEPIQPLISIPDRWHIKLPEDKTLAPLLNFYKDNIIVATFPLNPENLEGIMPILETFYERPEPTPKVKLTIKIKRWAKKHKFTAALAIIILMIVIVSITGSIITYIQY